MPGECDGVTFEIWGVLEGNASLEGEWGTIQLDAVAWVLLLRLNWVHIRSRPLRR